MAYIAIGKVSMVRYEPPLVLSAGIRRGSSGAATRRSTTMNITSRKAPAASSDTVPRSDQPQSAALLNPYTRIDNPTVARTAPSTS